MNKIHRSNVSINLAFSSRLYCLDYKNTEHLSSTESKLETARQTIVLSFLHFAVRLLMFVLKPILFQFLKLLTIEQKSQAIEYLAKDRVRETQQLKPTRRRKKSLLRLTFHFSRPLLRSIASRAIKLLSPVLTPIALKTFKLLKPEEKLQAIESLTKISLLETKQIKKSTRIKIRQMLEAIHQDDQQMAKGKLQYGKPDITVKSPALKRRKIKSRLLPVRNINKITRLPKHAKPNEGAPNLDSIAGQKISLHLKEKV